MAVKEILSRYEVRKEVLFDYFIRRAKGEKK